MCTLKDVFEDVLKNGNFVMILISLRMYTKCLFWKIFVERECLERCFENILKTPKYGNFAMILASLRMYTKCLFLKDV